MRAYIGLGANLGDREATLREALRLLGEADGVEVVAVSSLVETEPWGYADQPAFLNGAAALETTLHPLDLLALLLDVERRLGRVRADEAPRYGPRTVDLDLLVQAIEEDPRRVLPVALIHGDGQRQITGKSGVALQRHRPQAVLGDVREDVVTIGL